jgi:hypothetical protein
LSCGTEGTPEGNGKIEGDAKAGLFDYVGKIVWRGAGGKGGSYIYAMRLEKISQKI